MIYFFDDVLRSDNIDYTLSLIAKDFREKYNFPDIRQLGIVVANVETAAAELENKGMGPFFIASDTLDMWNERGKNKTFSGKVGLACHKGYEIELLEPGTGSNFYKSCVKKGRMVLQHLGFSVKNVDSFKRKLEESGNKTWVRGRIKSLGLVTEFAYMDTLKQAGIITELIDMRIFGVPLKNPHAGFYHNCGRLEKIIGKRSLSF
ncbi:hypothetical protein ASZ90_007969 [hydrocarbon metagenome]|uniref:VOC domain-containing protein n=1 Tax=hydrocarbon metagenome TaxID=938273 RepID=A0A0W8FMU7_9ZZZZ